MDDIRLLLLEDNPGDLQLCREMLKSANTTSWQLEHAASLADARLTLTDQTFDLIVLNLNLPDSQGLDTFQEVSKLAPQIPIVIMSGFADQAQALDAVQQGAQDYLIKDDLTPDLLSRALRYAVERHQLSHQVETLAVTDVLSGLLNRRGFFSLAEQQIKLAFRSKKEMSLFFMDIDDMKSINDRFGHIKGDLAIKAAAEALQRTFRDSDLLARMGGDEFAVLAIDTAADSQTGIYQRLLDQIRQVVQDNGLPFEFSMSIGAAEWNIQQTQNLELLLQQAGQAMYAHKRGENIFPEREAESGEPFKEQPPFYLDRLDILLVEDNPGDARLVEAYLADSAKDIRITRVDRLGRLRTLPAGEQFSVILLDLSLPDSHGIDTVTAVIKIYPEVPIVIFTGQDDNQLALEAIQAGAQDFLVKGSFDSDVLERALHYAVERNTLVQQNQTFLNEIHRSEQILQSIFDHVKFGIFRTDHKGELIFANRVMIDLLGYDSLFDAVGRNILRDHLELDRERVLELVAGQQEIKGDLFVLNAVGERSVPIRLGVSRSLDGEKAILTGTVEDISSQVESEEQLLLQASALDAAANAIMITDTQGEILWCNQALADLTGYRLEELTGQTPEIFNSGRQSTNYYQSMWESILAGRLWQGELVNRRKNGTTYSERMTITPLRNQSGEVTHFISIKEDITARLLDKAALERRLQEATAFHQVATAGIEETDEDQLITRVTEVVGKMVYSDHFGVLLLDDSGENLNVHPSYQGIKEEMRGLTFSIQEGVVGRCAHKKETILISDVRQEKVYISATPDVKSELAVPLIAEGKLIGVINAESTELSRFSEDDARLLETIANQLGTAISHIRIHSQEREQRKIAEILSDTALALNSSLEIDQILDRILDEIAELIPYKTASMFLGGKGRARAHRQRGYEELGLLEWIENFEIELGSSGIPGMDRLVAELKPELVADTWNSPDWIEIPETNWIRSHLGMPIVKNDILLGIINLDHDQPNAFNESDIEIVTVLANQVSTALENAELYHQQQEQLEFLESLRQIDYAITGSLDLQVILKVIMTEVMARLDIDAVNVLLYDADAYQVFPAASKGYRSHDLFQEVTYHVAGLLGQIIQQRLPCFVSNLDDTDLSVLRREIFQQEGFQSYFGLPLIVKGKIVGVMELFLRKRIEFQEDWQRYAATVATQTAIAVDNSQLFSNLQQANLELSLAYDITLEGWAGALEMRDQETEGHSRRVVDLTMELVKAMGVPEDQWVHIRRGALLHDIGKMGIPDRILLKPGKLDDEEWELMRMHPKFAEKWLKPIAYLRPALDIPLYHHERWDGAGYPVGLKGEQIPLAARIFSIIDVWDALRSDRPYRKAWPPEKTIEHIRSQSGKHFDPEVVKAFLELIEQPIPTVLAEEAVETKMRYQS